MHAHHRLDQPARVCRAAGAVPALDLITVDAAIIRQDMGFWHTGYMEFHEPTDFQLPAPREPSFVCDRCGESFASVALRNDHCFVAHPKHKPVLIVEGRELGASRLKITRTLSPTDVRLDCDRAWLNQNEIPACELRTVLAGCGTPDVCYIRLCKDGIDTSFELEFAIASEQDLARVEARFYKIVRGCQLNSRIVDDFIGAKSDFGTAIGYCDGICGYLYGILAREQRAGSTLAYKDYQPKFNNAAETLAGYDRPLARTIRSLIEFHFNHFQESTAFAPESRVGRTSERYVQWIRPDRNPPASGEEKPTAPVTTRHAPPRKPPDRALTDAATEKIICWSMCRLPDLAADANEIETRLSHDLPDYDKAKLHVLLGEFYATHGQRCRASVHAESLRHVPPFEAWAEKHLSSLHG